ncbi:MAG TPA: response regulator [Herpetosiphonaceae bacterium]|nr:response regulator [Herpetosiphonaceae bacterium]
MLDDSSEFQQLVQVMLTYVGINRISHWTASVEALPELKKSPPDLLILDVMMSGLTGLTVWNELRQTPNTRTLPIVVCTAAVNSIVEDEVRLQEDPYTVVLPKPFTLDELQAALTQLVPRWNA